MCWTINATLCVSLVSCWNRVRIHWINIGIARFAKGGKGAIRSVNSVEECIQESSATFYAFGIKDIISVCS